MRGTLGAVDRAVKWYEISSLGEISLGRDRQLNKKRFVTEPCYRRLGKSRAGAQAEQRRSLYAWLTAVLLGRLGGGGDWKSGLGQGNSRGEALRKEGTTFYNRNHKATCPGG